MRHETHLQGILSIQTSAGSSKAAQHKQVKAARVICFICCSEQQDNRLCLSVVQVCLEVATSPAQIPSLRVCTFFWPDPLRTPDPRGKIPAPAASSPTEASLEAAGPQGREVISLRLRQILPDQSESWTCAWPTIL